jgi:hypothetical protein
MGDKEKKMKKVKKKNPVKSWRKTKDTQTFIGTKKTNFFSYIFQKDNMSNDISCGKTNTLAYTVCVCIYARKC